MKVSSNVESPGLGHLCVEEMYNIRKNVLLSSALDVRDYYVYGAEQRYPQYTVHCLRAA